MTSMSSIVWPNRKSLLQTHAIGCEITAHKITLLITYKCNDFGSCPNKEMYVDVAREGVNLLVIPFKALWENLLSRKCHITSLYTAVCSASLPHCRRREGEC